MDNLFCVLRKINRLTGKCHAGITATKHFILSSCISFAFYGLTLSQVSSGQSWCKYYPGIYMIKLRKDMAEAGLKPKHVYIWNSTFHSWQIETYFERNIKCFHLFDLWFTLWRDPIPLGSETECTATHAILLATTVNLSHLSCLRGNTITELRQTKMLL